MKRHEQAIQRAVFQHIAQRGSPAVFAWHTPNGGRRSPIEAAIFKTLGVKAGVPDVIAVHQGHAYALELKAKGGRISPAQKATHEFLKAAGATVAVAEGLDEAIRILELWGILRRNSAIVGEIIHGEAA